MTSYPRLPLLATALLGTSCSLIFDLSTDPNGGESDGGVVSPFDSAPRPSADARPVGVGECGSTACTFGENSSSDVQMVTIDTYLRESQPANNFGASSHVEVDFSTEKNTLLRFELGILPPDTRVGQARILLTIEDSSPDNADETVELYLSLLPWEQGTESGDPGVPNWTQRTEVFPWPEPGANGPARSMALVGSFSVTGETPQSVSVQLPSEVVQNWIDNPGENLGLILAGSNPDPIDIVSSEGDDERRPELQIVFAP